jgi:hypothetical protein
MTYQRGPDDRHSTDYIDRTDTNVGWALVSFSPVCSSSCCSEHLGGRALVIGRRSANGRSFQVSFPAHHRSPRRRH